jgi:hypothetical protein
VHTLNIMSHFACPKYLSEWFKVLKLLVTMIFPTWLVVTKHESVSVKLRQSRQQTIQSIVQPTVELIGPLGRPGKELVI